MWFAMELQIELGIGMHCIVVWDQLWWAILEVRQVVAGVMVDCSMNHTASQFMDTW